MRFDLKIISLGLFLYLTSCAVNPNSSETIISNIALPTMQCGMCISNIENALNEVEGIDKIRVDLKKLNVKVKYNTEKISLQEIEQLITMSGYQANNKKANNNAYNQLAMCCRLPEDRK
tara:strand:+ start:188 stop:544 length:357 start_codon:yes stop_codon:yes gene_type:complete